MSYQRAFTQRLLLLQFNQVTTFVNSKFKKDHVFCLSIDAEDSLSVILFAQLVIGNVFVLRIARTFHAKKLVNEQTLTKIGTTSLLCVAISGILLAQSLSKCVFAIMFCVFMTFVALFLVQRRQIDALESSFPLFLDRWIMNLKMGMSPTAAKDRALRDESDTSQRILNALFHSEHLQSSQTDVFLSSEVIEELKSITQVAHQTVTRLEALRQRVRARSDFRRKSGQSLLQARIQSLTMAVLLIAIQILMTHRFGWNRVGDLVLVSFILAVVGAFVMHRLASKKGWKI